jgi:hypothetical protein
MSPLRHLVPIVAIATLGTVTGGCERAAPSAREDEGACVKGDQAACERRLKRMKESCEAKNVKSCVDTADAYFTPLYAAKDDKQAAVYFEKACDLGDGRSCELLADQYFAGRGVAANLPKALALDERACTLGYADGCRDLAQCLERADAFRGCKTKDLKKARDLWARRCELEKVERASCEDLARVEKLIAGGS